MTLFQFYVVMATHEMGAFIHVYDGESKFPQTSLVSAHCKFSVYCLVFTDTKYGKLYVSDSSGSRFTLSLNSHLYDIHYHMMGHYSVHDFYEVTSARGVYITSSVDDGTCTS